MYPAQFEYHAPASVAEALALLDRYQDEAKVIAGSQSLVPLMKLRLAQPAHLVDLRKLPGLTGVRETGEALQIGAMTSHRAIQVDPIVRRRLPVLSEAAGNIGDPQVRNMGTIGGSLAHADPAADWPAVALALDASVRIAGAKGERTEKVSEFIVGPLTSTLAPGELLLQIWIPLLPARGGAAYEKHPHPASGFAIVGVAAALTLDAKGAVQEARVAVNGLGPKAVRAAASEQALRGKVPDAAAVKAAAGRVTEGLSLQADLTGSAGYKAQLAAVTAERALSRAAARAAGK